MKVFPVMIYIQIHIFECERIKISNVSMEIVFDTQINDIMHDRVPCS